MKKRTAFIGSILSLISLGQPLLIKTSVVLSSTAVMLFVPEKVNAGSADFYLKKLRVIYRNKGEESKTIFYANELLQIDPFNYEGYWFRAYAKVEMGLFEDGIKDYKKSIELGDEDSQTYTNIGFAYLELGDNYRAISYFNKSIEMFSNSMQVYINRSIAKENIGDIKGACLDARKAVSLGDNDPKNKNWIKENCSSNFKYEY